MNGFLPLVRDDQFKIIANLTQAHSSIILFKSFDKVPFQNKK